VRCMRMKHGGYTLTLCAVMLLAASCGAEKEEPGLPSGGKVEGNGRNVILLTLDGLRQDHMSLFGYHRETTPNIDSLGRNGLAFTEIIPSSGSTKASLTSLLTAIDYRYHHLFHYRQKLPEDYYTIAEAYRDAGYLTMAVTASPILGRQLDYHQGFDVFEDFSRMPNATDYVHATEIGGKIISFLDRLAANDVKAPFFVYAHFEEPHPPWSSPSPWVETGEEEYETQPFDLGCTYVPTPAEYEAVTDAARTEWIAKYDGAIRQADEQIGAIMERLRKHSFMDNTIIAISTDHGYELLDRYAFGHGFSVYDEIVKTFLVIHDGSGTEHRPPPEPVQGRIFAVGPTLLALCGIEIPEQYEGVDLINDYDRLPRYAFCYDNGVTCVRTLDHKLVHIDFGEERPKPAAIPEFGFQLFDLQNDPGETRDIKDEQQQLFKKMLGEYDAYMADLEGEFVMGTTIPLDDATEERLRALGYIQ